MKPLTPILILLLLLPTGGMAQSGNAREQFDILTEEGISFRYAKSTELRFINDASKYKDVVDDDIKGYSEVLPGSAETYFASVGFSFGQLDLIVSHFEDRLLINRQADIKDRQATTPQMDVMVNRVNFKGNFVSLEANKQLWGFLWLPLGLGMGNIEYEFQEEDLDTGESRNVVIKDQNYYAYYGLAIQLYPLDGMILNLGYMQYEPLFEEKFLDAIQAPKFGASPGIKISLKF